MALRVLLAAIIVLALGLSGANHAAFAKGLAAPAPSSERHDASGHHAAAGHVHDAHDAADHATQEQGEPASASPGAGHGGNGCSNAEHCIGCSAHCPVMTIGDGPRLPVVQWFRKPFERIAERCETGALARRERPPEAI